MDRKEQTMKLTDLLAALSSNANVNVTLIDGNDNPMITFNAAGYGAVENDLGTRTVKRIKITSGTAVTISIEDAETAGDPVNNPGDP